MAEVKVNTLDSASELVYLVGNIGGGGQEEHAECSPYRGYRKEILREKLSLLEESFMVCGRCNGILSEGCSIEGGLLQVCKECVESGEEYQPIGSIRSAVVKIPCKCPLSDRGCEWKGVLGNVLTHLEECDQFVVRCPYVKYGCKKELKRQALDEHRQEAKEFHTEKVSVFMTEKMENLENEKKIQESLILEQNKKILKLETQIQQLMSFKKFTKFEGVKWIIGDRHKIVNKYNEKQGKPQDAIPEEEVKETAKYSGDLSHCYFGDSIYDGPRFVVATYYYLIPRMYFSSNNEITITIYTYNVGLYEEKIIWPLQGKCIVKLISQINEEDWIFENEVFQLSKNDSFDVTTIPFDTLLDEKFKKGNTIAMEILFQLHP